ncbi:MAG: hypothetical protein KAU46_04930 [Candidatus Aminicenantes bacterium]|nr:hypothetical protein [Candidatus Aminicenantes bacterium]
MGIVSYSLFFLPIHHYTYEIYYKRQKAYEEKEKKKCEDLYHGPYNKLRESFKRTLKNLWWRPPWKFNDTVGYLSIGTDTGGCLTADIFLKRKHLPKEHHNRRAILPKRTNEILYFREMDRFPKGEGNNNAYLQSLNELIETAKKIIKKRNRTFELWFPPFDFSCINLVEAIRQSKIKDAP